MGVILVNMNYYVMFLSTTRMEKYTRGNNIVAELPIRQVLYRFESLFQLFFTIVDW